MTVTRVRAALFSAAIVSMLIVGGLALGVSAVGELHTVSKSGTWGVSPLPVTAERDAVLPAVSPFNVGPPSVAVGPMPFISAVDPANGYLYVPDTGSDNVTIVSGTSVLATVDVGAPPYSATYDNVNGWVYVPYCICENPPWGGGVAVINGTSLVSQIPLNGTPAVAAVDSTNGLVYVADPNGGVEVINGTTLAGYVYDPGCPETVVYDPADGYVYAGGGGCSSGTNSIYVINGTSLVSTLPPVGSYLSGALYDNASGDVYFVNPTDGESPSAVLVVNGTVEVANLSVGESNIAGRDYTNSFPGYDPQSGYVYVPNGGSSNVTVIDGTSVVASVNVPALPNAVVAGGGGLDYVADTSANNVSVLEGTTVVANVAVGNAPAYEVYDPVDNDVYVVNLRSANVSVIPTPPRGAYSSVTFSELGLRAGARWRVSVGGDSQVSTTSSMVFLLANGTYPYLVTGPKGYQVPGGLAAGNLTVAGANLTETLTFARGPTFALSFSEKGLPKATTWCVEVAWVSSCTSKASEKYSNLTPGTYAYSLLSPTSGQTITAKVGGSPAPTSGNLTLTKSTTIAFTFVYPYSVTFTETGLPPGNGTWSVILKGQTHDGALGDPIVVHLANGTYGYKVGPESGYTASGSPPRVKVAGAPAYVVVTFKAKPSHAPRDLPLGPMGVAALAVAPVGFARGRRPGPAAT